ncbi:hypothetical protein EVG20_g921 [Dentipellis fragilis]|uniref:Single-stranded DNA-binding protein n=1 Tax=Dentipellis fragilis TaxID=205917 RepID=A0A4Y9ZDY2_9AGAM|nr:hypothetical protein EVG20_g921 [Dentipellis fragilis]
MFAAARSFAATRASTRAFSTTGARSADLAKLILIGRLGKDPEIRTTRTDKEYISYTVATTNYPPPPMNPDGSRPDSKTTWHHILSFNPGANNYLRTLSKGSQVYVEANFELREPDPTADPSTPQGQRQIFLRHENIRVIKGPAHRDPGEADESS